MLARNRQNSYILLTGKEKSIPVGSLYAEVVIKDFDFTQEKVVELPHHPGPTFLGKRRYFSGIVA